MNLQTTNMTNKQYKKWVEDQQEDYNHRLRHGSNEEVLRMYSLIVKGDDCDGAFTDLGLWELRRAETELKLRLLECNFLPQTSTWPI